MPAIETAPTAQAPAAEVGDLPYGDRWSFGAPAFSMAASFVREKLGGANRYNPPEPGDGLAALQTTIMQAANRSGAERDTSIPGETSYAFFGSDMTEPNGAVLFRQRVDREADGSERSSWTLTLSQPTKRVVELLGAQTGRDDRHISMVHFVVDPDLRRTDPAQAPSGQVRPQVSVRRSFRDEDGVMRTEDVPHQYAGTDRRVHSTPATTTYGAFNTLLHTPGSELARPQSLRARVGFAAGNLVTRLMSRLNPARGFELAGDRLERQSKNS